MKKITLIIIFLTFISNILFSQNVTNSDLTKKWELTNGWFSREGIELSEVISENPKHLFEFNENGTIKHIKRSEPMSCPVGVFTLKDGNWNVKDNILTLELRGLKISDYWYWWIIEYRMKLEEKKLQLEVLKRIKNREIPPTKTWEELIDE